MSNLRNPPYEAWLHLVTSYECNLNCNYCIAEATKPSKLYLKTNNINISALKNIINDSNKIYGFNITGGEPLLAPNIVEACIELTKKHFIALITNLTSKKVEKFADKINPERVSSILASCHIKELERRNLLSRYIDNFLLCKNRGFNIIANEVGYPPILKEIDKYKKFFLEKGIELIFSPYIGNYKGKVYPDSYSEKDFKIMGLTRDFLDIFYQYGKLCNAGYNVGVIFPNGDITYCYKINKSLGSIYEGIKFNDKLIRCPYKFCNCPFNMNDPYLFRKAIIEVGTHNAESIQPFKNRIKELTINFLNNHLTDNTRKLIIELFMTNKLTREYLLKIWI
jgi:MoaA/NifB/PqqE/SkfB family radical SAM enzyme